TAFFSPNPVQINSQTNSATSTLTISTTAVTSDGTTAFTVKAATSANDFATGNSSLVVTAACTAPSITTNPANQTVTYGQNATFSAAASGNPTPTVQWQVSTNSGGNWSNISGATNTTLSVIAPTVVSPLRQYRAVFTNNCGGTATATTGAATSTVDKKAASVSPNAADKFYGEADPTLTGTLNGFLAADGVTATYSRTAGETVAGSPYTISA